MRECSHLSRALSICDHATRRGLDGIRSNFSKGRVGEQTSLSSKRHSVGQVWSNSLTPAFWQMKALLYLCRWDEKLRQLPKSCKSSCKECWRKRKEKPLNRTCNDAITDPFLKLKLFVFDSICDVLQKVKGGRKERKKEESRIQTTTNLAYKQVLSLQSHVAWRNATAGSCKARCEAGNQWPGSQEVDRSCLQADSLADWLFLLRMSSGFIGRERMHSTDH